MGFLRDMMGIDVVSQDHGSWWDLVIGLEKGGRTCSKKRISKRKLRAVGHRKQVGVKFRGQKLEAIHRRRQDR